MSRVSRTLTALVIVVAAAYGSMRALALRPVPPASALGGRASGPVVIELFTSEGCSSCPPADRVLADFVEAGGPDGVSIVALSEHVDYWDRLGWKDPFSAASFTDRQQRYADMLFSDVYTPQMVIDGRWQLIGSDRTAALDAIRRAAARPKIDVKASAARQGAEILVHASIAAATGATRPDADVLVAITEDGLVSNVLAGENGGRRLAHAAVTRYLGKGRRLNAGDAGEVDFRVPVQPAWRLDRSKIVVLVQSPRNLALLGAASVALDANAQAPVE